MRLIKTVHLIITHLLFSMALLLGSAHAQAKLGSDPLVLRTPEGAQRTIEDYQNPGKWSVVVFWASDCRVCNVENQQYSKLHDRRKDTDLKVLGVSLDGWDNVDDARLFIKRNRITFPNLVGENAFISKYFEQKTGKYLSGTPAIFIYDKKGELVAAEIGAVPVSVIEKYVASYN